MFKYFLNKIFMRKTPTGEFTKRVHEMLPYMFVTHIYYQSIPLHTTAETTSPEPFS